jgi:hypothetical protein
MFVQSNIFPAEEVSRWSTKQNVDSLLGIFLEDQSKDYDRTPQPLNASLGT